jgi:threonine synthase
MKVRPNMMLRCTGCGSFYPLGVHRCTCNRGILRLTWPSETFQAPLTSVDLPGVWRYAHVLPQLQARISFSEGRTPVVKSSRLGKELGIELSYKDETRNPTGSFKDRAAAVMLSVAKEMGFYSITTASSGNAAGAIALYSLLAGINAFVFMFKPSEQKLVQTLSYGATVLIVDTKNEARVLELAEEAADAFGWALLNTTATANPFVIEGYKTISYELHEQGDIPDWIVIPVGSGSMLIGIWQGLRELEEIGLIKELPRLLGVQPTGSAPIASAFSAGEEYVKPIRQGEPIATALSLEDPGVSGIETMRAVRESNGRMIAIDDTELIRTTRDLPRKDGIFAEASGAIGVAGAVQAVKQRVINAGQKVCCVISGGGLKDYSVFRGGKAPEPIHVPDSMDGVASVLKQQGITTS